MLLVSVASDSTWRTEATPCALVDPSDCMLKLELALGPGDRSRVLPGLADEGSFVRLLISALVSLCVEPLL